MLKERFQEGPCAPPFFSAVATLLWATVASAQPVDRADLVHCAAMSTDARKLACFESLLEEPAGASDDRAAETAVAPAQEPPPVASSVAESRIAPEVAAAGKARMDSADVPNSSGDALLEGGVEPDAAREPIVASGDSVASPVSEGATAAAKIAVEIAHAPAVSDDAGAALMRHGAAASAQPMASAAQPDSATDTGNVAAVSQPTDPASDVPATLSDDFGREHVANVADEPEERVTATVTNVTRDYTKRLVFQFENGQVWRQQEARRFQYPKDGAFDVEIARGVFGDYQLRVNGEGRMTRIKRLQ